MARKFREWSPRQSWLFPPSPSDWLPENHLVYFLLDVVEQLDLDPIISDYDSPKGGKPPHHPGMMVTLLLYAYCVGVFSSRKIMARCESDVAFRTIVGEDVPDFRRIAEFRRRHLGSIQHLFLEVLRLCKEAGLLSVGRLALDGTKVKANASRHKAMSYERMNREEERLQKEIDELLAKAQNADETEDVQYGRDRRGDELPDELARREKRLEKIREAKAALEQAAREKAAAEAEQRKAEGKRPCKTPPEKAVPAAKAQRNFTDPESRIMRSSNKGWDQSGNAQAVANEKQVIVAADVTDQANDVRQVEPMVNQAMENTSAAGVDDNVSALLADAGYFSEDNVATCESHDRIKETYFATGRMKHNEKIPASPKGRPPKGQTPKQKMARKLRTKRGKKEYSRRKGIIEPVFGQIKQCQGFRQFSLRGLAKMQSEWRLVCLTHNLLKLFRHVQQRSS